MRPTAAAAAPRGRGLTVTKSVTAAGAASIGDTLTCSLTVTTTGDAAQTVVTVSDYLPGYRPGSAWGTTTYVAGSATCAGSGTCSTSSNPGTHQVNWGLGVLSAGSARTVTFPVTIDRPAETGDTIPGPRRRQHRCRRLDQVPPVTSNRVVTRVAAVEAVRTRADASSGTHGSGASVAGTRTGSLPHTDAARTWAVVATGALLLLGSSWSPSPSWPSVGGSKARHQAGRGPDGTLRRGRSADVARVGPNGGDKQPEAS